MNLTMPISNQANEAANEKFAMALEGSEDRSQAEAVMDPRVPSTLISKEMGGDISRYSGETRRAEIKSSAITFGTASPFFTPQERSPC